MESGSKITQVGREKTRGQRSRSRDAVVEFETRLAKVELAIADGQEKFEAVEQGLDGLREKMQSAMNQVLAQCLDSVKAMEETHKTEISSMREELGRLLRKLENTEEELSLCKRALAQGNPSTSKVRTAPSKLDIPRPKCFKGSRNAKELDNFIWSMEQYFRALAMTDEVPKVDMASLYLEDTAMVWWRRRQGTLKAACALSALG